MNVMDAKKILISGIVAGLVVLVISMIIGMATGDLYAATPGLWKPMGDAWYMQMVIFDMMVGILFAFAFYTLYKGIPGKGATKGVIFGFLVWLVQGLPGMGMTYLSMSVPDVMVGIWTLNGLINAIVMGGIIAILYEKL